MFSGALEARKIDTDQLSSTVVGEVERGGDASRLRKIDVHYRLEVDATADRAAIDRVLGFHAQHCGVYRSLHPQVAITTSLDLVVR